MAKVKVCCKNCNKLVYEGCGTSEIKRCIRDMNFNSYIDELEGTYRNLESNRYGNCKYFFPKRKPILKSKWYEFWKK